VASALARGHAGLADFRPERIADPALRPLLAATALQHSAAFEALYPRQWPSNVTVAFADGRVISQTVNAPKGDPENAVSAAELDAKFAQMLEGTPYDPAPWMAFARGIAGADVLILPAQTAIRE
jgi:2-methylcitrate dehydratase PrpD